MKMNKRLIFFVIPFIFLVAFLTSCGDSLPTTKYEKVAFAFNGVEKSLKDIELDSNIEYTNKENIKLLSATNLTNGLNTLDGIYTSGDSLGDIIDDLEYTQPPMIQFQCLKYVLEAVGKSYEFGTKYYNDMTGVMYFDMVDGFKKAQSNEYKYDYLIRIALSITINDNDLINADVSFDITLSKDGKTFGTTWYVNMELDYDMENKTPNYTLAMYTANEQEALTFKEGYTYEYDYVNVIDNKINEWRKFCLESTKKLVKDSNHNSINSYLNEECFDYDASTAKWYKNNNLRKITQMTNEKKIQVANVFYNDIGLNNTDIDGSVYRSKNGLEIDAIKDLYSEMTRLFKDDVIYSLVCRNEDDNKDKGNNGQDHVIRIVARANNQDSFFENHVINGDPKLSDLFTNSSYWSSNSYPEIYIIWSENEREEKNSDLSKLTFMIKPEDENPIPIGINDKISEILKTANAPELIEKIDIIIKYPNTDITGVIPSYLGEDIKQQLVAVDPYDEVKELGFPEIKAIAPKYKKQGDEYIISNITSDECMNYRGTLEGYGFTELDGERFVKVTKDKKLLTATIYNSIYDYDRTITLNVNDSLTDKWDQNLIDSYLGDVITLPRFTSNNNLLFDYVTTGDLKRINIYVTSEQEISNYIQSLVNNENIFYLDWGIQYGNQSHAGIRIVDSTNNKYYEIAMFGDKIMDISLNPNHYDIEVIKFKVNNGSYQTLTRDFSERCKFISDAITLNQNDVITFIGDNVTVNKVDVNSSDYVASGNTLTYVYNSQTNVKIWVYGYDSEEGSLSIQFEYSHQGPDYPKEPK